MTTIHQILFATDLSSASEPAWREAQQLGYVCGAEIVLTHVVAPLSFVPPGYYAPRVAQEIVDAAYRIAQDGIDRLLAGVAGPPLKVRSRIETGSSVQRILEVAREEAANLVVVGTHDRSGMGRVVLGSVADRVLRQAACPVVTVRADIVRESRGTIRRICYATDFSATARAAWQWVVTLAQAGGAEVDLVHVPLGPIPDRHLSADAIGEMARFLDDQGRAAAEQFLQDSPLSRERVHVRIGRGVEGDQIVHWAQKREADLIVMGTHGWSGLVRWMLGSVVQHVIQVAPCPVLTIGPASQHKEGQDAS